MTSRRTFVKGLALGGAAASLGLVNRIADAQSGARAAAGVLEGTEFDLRIGDTTVNLTGRDRVARTINGSLPGPLLRWREGDTVTLRVSNALDEDTAIHWHGLLLPANMDGVPGLSFDGIRPGGSYTYRFPRPPGRHLLVPLARRLPGAAGRLRPAGDRAARAGSDRLRSRARRAAHRLDRRGPAARASTA